MIITREIDSLPYQFELTKDELISAYFEQQEIFDIDSCRSYLDRMYCNAAWYESLNDEKREAMICDAASELRRNIDKYDMHYDYAMCDAFETAIDRIVNCVRWRAIKI